MTFVGKILVIVIMAFALMFLGISTVVFSTAENWKELTTKERQKVQELQTKNSTATASIESLKKDLEKAKGEHAVAKQSLEAQIGTLRTDIERIQNENTTARTEVVKAQENANTALAEAEARRKEAVALREQKLAVEKQANDYRLNRADLVDRIRILTRELEVAKNNANDLRERSAKFSSLLRTHGLSDDISNLKGLESPPAVHGEVGRVEQNKQVELTIGSDDGLVVGHELHIYRLTPRPEYIGKIRVTHVDPDRAVGQVIGNTVQGKKIKEGDIVSSTFRSGPRS